MAKQDIEAASIDSPSAALTKPLERLADSISSLAEAVVGRTIDGFMVGLVLIMLAQAIWLAVLMHSGWYYQADFSNLASATGASLNSTYLTTSQGGHLDVVGRLVLWVLNRTVPLNYDATIVLRVVASAAVTYLLGRLLRELVGARRGVLALLLLFALSPLLVQSTLWLTSSINFLISELLVLAALRCFVRYAVDDLLGWALLAGTAMLCATLVAEQAAVTALAFPLLTFGFLAQGSWRERLRAVWHSWPAWLMMGLPIIGFAAFYFGSGKYSTKSSGFTLADAARLVGRFWFDAFVPGLFGGPLAWSTKNGNYFAFSNAALAVRVAAMVLLVTAVVWTVRRTSMQALYGWAIPLVVSGIGLVFVGRARVEVYGIVTVARRFEYGSYAAIPAAMGIALAIWSTSADDIRARLADGQRAPKPVDAGAARHASPRRWTAAVVVVALSLLSAISAGTYASAWSKSPSKAYVSRLSASLSKAGDNATVFDTFVATGVVPGIENHRHVSDLLTLMGKHPYINNGPVPPEVVSSNGALSPAKFLVAASVQTRHTSTFCNNLFVGRVVKTQRFSSTPHASEWFLQLTYFEARPTIINVHVITRRNLLISPVGGSQVLLQARVGIAYVRFSQSQPAAVRIQGATTATNVCLTKIAVGYPFAAQQ